MGRVQGVGGRRVGRIQIYSRRHIYWVDWTGEGIEE
jgi:hypothetical protein